MLINRFCQHIKNCETATIANPTAWAVEFDMTFLQCMSGNRFKNVRIQSTPAIFAILLQRVRTAISLAQLVSQNSYFFGGETEKS